MALIQAIGSVARGIGRFFGLGGAAGAVTGRIGRAARAVAPGVAGGAAFELGARAFDGDDGFDVPGDPISMLTRGRTITRLEDGSIATFTREGRLVRPNLIVPFGQKLPRNFSNVVSISGDGRLIGVTIRRPRRRFASELRRVRNVIRSAQAITRSVGVRRRTRA